MKDKNKINQNRAKAKQKQEAKRKQKKLSKNVELVNRQAFSTIEAPDGFKTVSASQGLMYYGEPILSKAKNTNDDINTLNKNFQIAVQIWNYVNPRIEHSQEEKSEIIQQIKDLLDIEDIGAENFFEMMVQRKNNLFPEEIQPEGVTILFQRKIDTFQIEPVQLSELGIHSDRKVDITKYEEILERLKDLDRRIENEHEYLDYEDLMFEAKESFESKFVEWMKELKFKDKNIENTCFAFSVYYDFIYGYMHEDITKLNSVEKGYIQEFFRDYAIRKVMINPEEQAEWTGAIEIAYLFLLDIQYIDEINAKRIQKYIKEEEPRFIKYLRKNN